MCVRGEKCAQATKSTGAATQRGGGEEGAEGRERVGRAVQRRGYAKGREGERARRGRTQAHTRAREGNWRSLLLLLLLLLL